MEQENHNIKVVSLLRKSEYVVCVLNFLFLIEFSSHLHSIFFDFDYGSFSFFFCLLFCGLIFGTGCNNNGGAEGNGALPMQGLQQ